MPWETTKNAKEEGMATLKRSIAFLFIVVGLFLVSGCATTGKNYTETPTDQSAKVDELLGVGDASTEGDINEDDVLKLLGVSDEGKTETSASGGVKQVL
jgi:uncharacterized lipoprotein YajG